MSSRKVIVIDLGSEAAVASFSSTADFVASTTSVPHPRLNTSLTFLTSSTGTPPSLFELNSLQPSKYCSYFSNSTIISDGNLYCATRFDPLFLILPHLPKVLSKFAPFDQIQSELATVTTQTVANAITEVLLEKVTTVSDAMGDDMLIYKFNEDKALDYLQSKFTKVVAVLAARDKKHLEIANNGGSKSFNLGEEVVSGSEEVREKKRLEIEANGRKVAVISIAEYLNEEWKLKLCEKVNVPVETLEPKGTSVKRKAAWEVGRDEEQDKLLEYTLGSKEMINNVAKEKEAKKEKTTAQKQLEKASKGTKSLSSFFGAPKPKKK